MVDAYPHRVRDPIHGFIHFSEEERRIIDSREFQRLRFVGQLALTYYVYPGAMHTRFEHSLGVMEMATRVFENICSKSGDLVSQSLKQIDLTIDAARKVLRLAALLHDIGHLPFSHGGEVILPKGTKHEDVSIAIIDYLTEFIDGLIFEGAANIAKLLIKKDQVIPELRFLKSILSGPVDADRMDYLLRDSHHCGVSYGSFDHRRLIETLSTVPGNSGGLDLAVDQGGIHSIEALILARYYMFTQVYCHRTRRIYDIYLKEFMAKWKPDLEPLTNVVLYDDIVAINKLRFEASDKKKLAYDIAQRICRRNNHSVIYETSEFADARMVRDSIEIFNKLKGRYSDHDFIHDNEAKGTIHKFFVPGDENEGEELLVLHKQRERLVTEESEIIRRIPKKFHVVRIYTDVKDGEVLHKLREEAGGR